MNPVVLGSARKHGVDDPDMLHAYRYPDRVFELEGLTMIVGADEAGRLLEVGVVVGESVPFIVHVMRAREPFLR